MGNGLSIFKILINALFLDLNFLQSCVYLGLFTVELQVKTLDKLTLPQKRKFLTIRTKTGKQQLPGSRYHWPSFTIFSTGSSHAYFQRSPRDKFPESASKRKKKSAIRRAAATLIYPPSTPCPSYPTVSSWLLRNAYQSSKKRPRGLLHHVYHSTAVWIGRLHCLGPNKKKQTNLLHAFRLF